MIDYEQELLKRGEAFRGKFGKQNPNHAELRFIDADLAGRRARIAQLQTMQSADEAPLAGEDMLAVFGCRLDQIAHSAAEITAETRAFVGPLTQGIFQRFPTDLEHIYTSYPEGRIIMGSLNITGQSGSELEAELDGIDDVQIGLDARHMLHSDKFETLVYPNYRTAMLRVQDTGLRGTPTTEQLFERAAWLGLALCLSAVGPHQRKEDTDQPLNNVYWIAMKQIPGRDGNPDVFELGRDGDGRWLRGRWAGPDRRWGPEARVVFSVPQVNLKP